VHTICCFVIDELHVAHTLMPPIAQEQLVRVERPALSLHSGTNEFHGYLRCFAEHYVVQLSIFHPRCQLLRRDGKEATQHHKAIGNCPNIRTGFAVSLKDFHTYSDALTRMILFDSLLSG
jgi:hypothetical protein